MTWQLPPVSLLATAPVNLNNFCAETQERNAQKLQSILNDFGVRGRVVEVQQGPVVTLYGFQPQAGIRAAKIIGLADDIARLLSVDSVRVATIVGRNVIGIEVPNATRTTVYLSEVLGHEAFATAGALPLALGKDIGGKPVCADLSKMPHLLVAGTTGSGKSVGLNAMILSLLYKFSPDEMQFIFIDPKMLELSVYNGLPHLLTPVITDPLKAVQALQWATREMERRYRVMADVSVRNMLGFNEHIANARQHNIAIMQRVQTGFDGNGEAVFEERRMILEKMPYIVIVIDEMADLMSTGGKSIDATIQRLAQMARAAGIHIITATQRPSVDVITGTIKANFPTRISFSVVSKFDSKTILGEQGAEQLLGHGDMLYMGGGHAITRVHGPFVSDTEIERVVDFVKLQRSPLFHPGVVDA